MIRILTAAAASLLIAASAFAQSSSQTTEKTPAPAAASHPALQDHHEGLTIAVDPYTNSDRAKDKFGKSANPVPVGILPVEVTFTNELPHPLKIDMETVEMEVYMADGKQDLDWLAPVQVATLIVHPGGNPSAPSTRRFPIGIGMPSKDKKVEKIAGELRPFALDSDVIPPLGKIHGFLFFNMNNNFEAASKSTLYIPDVATLPDRKPLMFFEVPLALGAQAQ